MFSLLIVDDEQPIIDGIRAMIHWPQYQIDAIYSARDYHEALEKAIRFHPDIAIVDIRIDDKYGYDLINRIHELNAETRFIMMSGYDNFEYVRASMIAGAKEYLLKPVNCEELKKIVTKIVVQDLGGRIEETPPTDEKNIDPILNTEYQSLSSLTNRILSIVQTDYDKDLSLLSIAETFKMNSRYLGQVFLSETKMKFSEYLFAFRMKKARILIETTDEKISYIARQVGYSNPNYFYSHFKSYYNLSPRELRKRSDEDEVNDE